LTVFGTHKQNIRPVGGVFPPLAFFEGRGEEGDASQGYSIRIGRKCVYLVYEEATFRNARL